MHDHDDKELKCEACDVTFENEEEMKKHMSEAHGKEDGDEHSHDH